MEAFVGKYCQLVAHANAQVLSGSNRVVDLMSTESSRVSQVASGSRGMDPGKVGDGEVSSEIVECTNCSTRIVC